MFGLDPDVITLIGTVWVAGHYAWIYNRPRPPMKKVVSWEVVAELEHEFGYDHYPESEAVCTHPSHVDEMPVGNAIDILAKGLANGVLGPNEWRVARAFEGIVPDLDIMIEEHKR